MATWRKHIKPIVHSCKFEPTEKSKQWSGITEPRYSSEKPYGIRRKLVGWQIKLDEIKREVPVYSKNYNSKYLQGVCDAILTYHIEIEYCQEDWKMEKVYDEEAIQKYINKNIEYNKKYPTSVKMEVTREHAIQYAHVSYTWKPIELVSHYQITENFGASNWSPGAVYKLLIDFKPKLNSISGIIGQLKVYKDCMGPSDLMIITYDKNEKYDPILKDENIHIMRIEEEQ